MTQVNRGKSDHGKHERDPRNAQNDQEYGAAGPLRLHRIERRQEKDKTLDPGLTGGGVLGRKLSKHA